MLISIHGSDAEGVAIAKLQDAEQRSHEGDEIVWNGIITALASIRADQA